MKFFLFFSFLLIGLASYNDTLFANEVNCLTNLQPVKDNSKSIVIVSCCGKAGSSTLEASFKRLNFETYRRHVLTSQMCNYIFDRSQDTNILLVDSIRDILSRKIASYFQNLKKYLNLSAKEILARYHQEGINFVNFLIKDFNERIINIAQSYAFYSWKNFNYDCLKDSIFDFERKYQLKKMGNLYFVNVRFDDIQDWEKIIKSIDLPLDLNQFQIVSVNRSQNKWYKNLYQDFLKHFTLSQASFDAILSKNSEEITHFYTEKEIEKFINKWKPYIRD